MFTTAEANEFAQHWIDAWNAHGLTLIISHYSSDVIFSSPLIRKVQGKADGILHGRDALLDYFTKAPNNYPSLHFQLHSVLCGIETVTLLYDSVNGLLAAETMRVNNAGQITQVWAQYDRFE